MLALVHCNLMYFYASVLENCNNPEDALRTSSLGVVKPATKMVVRTMKRQRSEK